MQLFIEISDYYTAKLKEICGNDSWTEWVKGLVTKAIDKYVADKMTTAYIDIRKIVLKRLNELRGNTSVSDYIKKLINEEYIRNGQ